MNLSNLNGVAVPTHLGRRTGRPSIVKRPFAPRDLTRVTPSAPSLLSGALPSRGALSSLNFASGGQADFETMAIDAAKHGHANEAIGDYLSSRMKEGGQADLMKQVGALLHRVRKYSGGGDVGEGQMSDQDLELLGRPARFDPYRNRQLRGRGLGRGVLQMSPDDPRLEGGVTHGFMAQNAPAFMGNPLEKYVRGNPQARWNNEVDENILGSTRSTPQKVRDILGALLGSTPSDAGWGVKPRGFAPSARGLSVLSALYSGDASGPELREPSLAERISTQALEPSALEIAKRWGDAFHQMGTR